MDKEKSSERLNEWDVKDSASVTFNWNIIVMKNTFVSL